MTKEWFTEPAYGEFTHAGFKCEIKRHPRFGILCGYVGLAASHPAFDCDYDALDFDVHGGLTYGILHDDGLKWFGFDCAHGGDLAPGMEPFEGDVYRNWSYVEAEVRSLAEQLAAMERSSVPA